MGGLPPLGTPIPLEKVSLDEGLPTAGGPPLLSSLSLPLLATSLRRALSGVGTMFYNGTSDV